ncbi:hypothetical protein BC936DRAFT_144645, partial [Jimgerdemannia flammicorona]
SLPFFFLCRCRFPFFYSSLFPFFQLFSSLSSNSLSLYMNTSDPRSKPPSGPEYSQTTLLYARRGIAEPGKPAGNLDLNIRGTFNVPQKVAAVLVNQEPMNEDGERGVIINTVSIAYQDSQVG